VFYRTRFVQMHRKVVFCWVSCRPHFKNRCFVLFFTQIGPLSGLAPKGGALRSSLAPCFIAQDSGRGIVKLLFVEHCVHPPHPSHGKSLCHGRPNGRRGAACKTHSLFSTGLPTPRHLRPSDISKLALRASPPCWGSTRTENVCQV
jgi:hypothetical protein